MKGSYIPPFRRGAAGEAAGDADTPPVEPPPGQRRQYTPNIARATSSGQENHEENDGGRGESTGNFSTKSGPPFNQSDLHFEHDIDDYFWGGKNESKDSRGTTLRDSKDRVGELSYALLYFGENSRWPHDRIVFAKSNLALLPEYTTKKAKNGEWETEDKTRKNARTASWISTLGLPERQIKQEQESDTSSIQTFTTAVQAPGSHNQRGSYGANRPSFGGRMGNWKREDWHRSVKAKESVSDETRATPLSTPRPTRTSGPRKYADTRRGETLFSRTPRPPSTANLRKWDTYNRFTPPAEPSHQQLSSEPLLPTYPSITPIDYVPANAHPIAVFEERRGPWGRTGGPQARFAFKGWFRISQVKVVAPHSAELVGMLQQKWELRDRYGNVFGSRARGPSAWNDALTHEWAVVRFEILKGEDALPPPQIEKVPESEQPGVNEMLSEMRLNDIKSEPESEGN
ncbi:hypothetical protein F5Y07DRAFT_375841 [Xylaria sp. FL0933]|nr:hypothetical protein F5Y07DRAFT_375841 [Xylaria sp. FL0933]